MSRPDVRSIGCHLSGRDHPQSEPRQASLIPVIGTPVGPLPLPPPHSAFAEPGQSLLASIFCDLDLMAWGSGGWRFRCSAVLGDLAVASGGGSTDPAGFLLAVGMAVAGQPGARACRRLTIVVWSLVPASGRPGAAAVAVAAHDPPGNGEDPRRNRTPENPEAVHETGREQSRCHARACSAIGVALCHVAVSGA